MLTFFLEGLKAVLQPCSMVLIIPGLGAILAAQRHAMFAFPGYVLGAALTRWLMTAGYITVPTSDLLLGITVIIGVALIWIEARHRNWFFTALGAYVIASVAAMLWRPCVDGQLESVVIATTADPLSGLPKLFAYVAGLCGILVLTVLGPLAFGGWRSTRDRVSTGIIGITIGASMAVFTAIGSVSGWSERLQTISGGGV